jgi:hypothetical protein
VIGGVFSKKKHIRNKTMEGVVLEYSTVQDKKGLGKGGMNQNIISESIGEEKVYAR